MVRRKLFLFVVVALVALAAVPAAAQDATPTPFPLALPIGSTVIDPNASITFPPPVYLVRGTFPVRGSANLPNMVSYFVEYRPLALDQTSENTLLPWFPVSLPSTTAVANDLLAEWNTTTVPDGVYELRLTVTLSDGQIVTSVVRPVRVENNPPPFVQVAVPLQPGAIPTLTLPPQALQPTQPPPPTSAPQPTSPSTPIAIFLETANVRTGDNIAYASIGGFSAGTELPIIGISNRGTGWYLVRLPDGRQGWVAPSVIRIEGNANNLPGFSPPPPAATRTPTPIPATATPVTSADLVAGIVVLDPSPPVCGDTFTVGFDVANLGTGPTNVSSTISLVDTSGGEVRGSTTGGFPVINPGQTYRALMPITITEREGEGHTITLTIDPANIVPETNEGNNVQTVTYTLQNSDDDDCD